MYFANPWGLLGLVSLPIIVAIHLYHRRFPPLPVAGLHLWTQEIQKESPGRKREKLPITRSLILELLAALLISMLLADPRDSSITTTPHLVVLLDDSASMSAEFDGQSSKQRAIEWLEERAKQGVRGELYSVITTGYRPTLIAGPRVDWESVDSILDSWTPEAPKHDFNPAWDLAAQLAGDDEAEMVFLTDELPPETAPFPERMEAVSVGRRASNVGFTTARWLYSAETGEGTVFARLSNFGPEAAEVTVQGKAKSQQLINTKMTIPSGTEQSVQWVIPGGAGVLDLTLVAPEDSLAIDNRLQLVEPEVRTVTVSVVLPSEHTAFDPVKRILGVLPGVQLGDPPDADLIVGNATDAPPSNPNLWWIGFGPVSSSEEPQIFLGPYLVEKQHPLMKGVVMGGVVWGGARPMKSPISPIISVGSTPLVGQLQDVAPYAILWNIDLGASNIDDTPDWPIFWTNLVENCRESRPGFQRWNYHQDESISFSLPDQLIDSKEQLTLKHADDSKPLVRMESVVIPPRDEAGLYEVYDGEELFGRFAVNFFDREESDLSNISPGVRPPQINSVPLGIRIDNPFSWLLILGILIVVSLILWDWLILAPQRKSKAMG